jgi:arsenate reductase-like glutaredoxin family protein
VDFTERGPTLGELRRFSERYGVSNLVDRASRRFLDLGLQRSMHSDDWWLQRLTEEPAMLKQPLVRFGKHVTVGLDENTWRAWLSS